jgi:hypothetical protein
MSEILSLLCISSEAVLVGSLIAAANNPNCVYTYVLCSLAAALVGLPILIAVAVLRRTGRMKPGSFGLEVLGLLCLIFSWWILTGFALRLCEEHLTPLGLAASRCFKFAILAKSVQLAIAVVVGKWRNRGAAAKAAGPPRAGWAVDIFNGLCVLMQMFTIVGGGHGAGLAGPAIFFLSPAEPIGVIALIAAAFLRRTKMRNVILIDVFGSLCLLTTWWTNYYPDVLEMSELRRQMGEPVRGVLVFCLAPTIPFLFVMLCKFLCLAEGFIRRRPWTQYTLAGMLVFFVACVPLFALAARVLK